MTKLSDYKSKPLPIIGSTTINHASRVALQLNCSEYVLLDCLARIQEKGLVLYPDTTDIYLKTGFDLRSQEIILKALMSKAFIIVVTDKNGKPRLTVTDKWMNASADIEKEFDAHFWKVNGSVAWTGTRKKSLELYVKLRKKYSKEILVEQRNYYFEYLKLEEKNGFARQKMMCQVFLNPANERFLEDYKDYANQIRKKLGLLPDTDNTQPITRDDVNKAYGKNSNK